MVGVVVFVAVKYVELPDVELFGVARKTSVRDSCCVPTFFLEGVVSPALGSVLSASTFG